MQAQMLASTFKQRPMFRRTTPSACNNNRVGLRPSHASCASRVPAQSSCTRAGECSCHTVKGKGAVQLFDSGGGIANWDGYEAMLKYVLYDQLGWPVGDEGFVLATENTTTTSRSDRERVAQIMFESFNVRGMYLLDSAVASLYTANKISGVSVDIGLTGTTVAQVRSHLR
jgi:hypothetical protein